MQQTALAHDGSTHPGANTSDKPIERCWRVIVAPEGHIATCAVYERVTGDLQLRIVYKPEEVVRVAAVQQLETARSLAAQWLVDARQSGWLERCTRAAAFCSSSQSDPRLSDQ
jgi:hypothetical protein